MQWPGFSVRPIRPIRPISPIAPLALKTKVNMKVSFTILSFFTVCAVSAQSPVDVSWSDGGTVRISFVLGEGGDSIGSDYAVRAVPMITDAHGDTLRLAPTVFRGKRNMRYTERARYYGTAGPAVGDELPLGSTHERVVEFGRGEYPWLWDDKITFTVERTKEGCCDAIPMSPTPLGSSIYIPPFVPVFADVPDNTGKAGELERDNPVLQHISKYRPYDDTRILRKEKGALYVHFPLDKAVISHDFRSNGPTLDRIVSITRDIMADTTSSVKVIQIIGLASVEGSVTHNRRLAGERAVALKRYIQSKVPTVDSLYECVNGGEAWTELRDQIADTDNQWRGRLLEIIDTERNLDARERKIRALDGGRAYAFLKDNVLSDQRNSGYLRIYYDYVPDTAAKTINAATALLRQEKYAEALDMLLTVKADPRSWNAIGVALYMTGDTTQAMSYFRKSADGGNAQAKDNLRQAEVIMSKGEKLQ